MEQQHTNLIWTVLAVLFLYLGLAFSGPFYFHGGAPSITCCYCALTPEGIQFTQMNLFLRGVLVTSFALMIQVYWTKVIAFLAIFLIFYYPLNDVTVMMRTGELSIAYFIIPPFGTYLTDKNFLWLSLYQSNWFIILGAIVSIFSYFLLHAKFGNKYKIIFPSFVIFILSVWGGFFFISNNEMYSISFPHIVLSVLSIIAGLRIYIKNIRVL